MRIAVFGLTALVVLVIVFSGKSRRDSASAEPPGPQTNVQSAIPSGHPMAAARDLMAFSSSAANGMNQVTLIDVEKRVMSVYHIGGDSGEIELKSVRNVRWDLLMEEFNGVRPLPREIRALLEQR